MVAQVPAVVTPEHDDRVACQTARIQRIEHLTKLRVHVACGGMVAVDEVNGLLLRQRSLLRDVPVLPQFTPGRRRKFRRACGCRLQRRQLEARRIIEVPVLLRCHKRQMRF